MRNWGRDERIEVALKILEYIATEVAIKKARWQAVVAMKVLTASVKELQQNEREIEDCAKGWVYLGKRMS